MTAFYLVLLSQGYLLHNESSLPSTSSAASKLFHNYPFPQSKILFDEVDSHDQTDWQKLP